MKLSKTRLAIFFAGCAIGVLLAWLSGYNFSDRNLGVAMYFGTVLVFSIWVAAIPMDGL